jgi:hypothetical protein
MIRALSVLLMIVLLSNSSLARSKASVTVNFATPVKVGSKVLPEGVSEVTWTGSGPNVQVSFVQLSFTHGKTVVTVPAKLVPAQNHWAPLSNSGYEAITEQADGATVLDEIELPHLNLLFGRDATGQP